MFDVFTEEIEVQIKTGIANLYWFKPDLKKAWLRSGVNPKLCNSLFLRKNEKGETLTKRQLMDLLYENLRTLDYNRKLEISRNFVRILVEHQNFVPQDEKHRIEIAERCALKLKEIIANQDKERENRELIRLRVEKSKKEDYHVQLLRLRERFNDLTKMKEQERGYELEKLFTELMKISNIPVEKSFKIIGEQMDGAIKHEGHHYIIELRWRDKKSSQNDISSLYLKVEGKLEARGIFIAMDGFSNEVLSSLPKGKGLKVLLLDGIHLSNVIYGLYTFKELLDYALNQASLRGEIYCAHEISR
jgi:hypothetical protein